MLSEECSGRTFAHSGEQLMFLDFASESLGCALPLSSTLSQAIEQARFDVSSFERFGTKNRRRNAVLFCSGKLLRHELIHEAFRNTRLYLFDWKGRVIDRNSLDKLMQTEFSNKHNELATVLIFDAHLMDCLQIQCLSHMLDVAPIPMNFVLSAPQAVSAMELFRAPIITFDARTAGTNSDYKRDAGQFFKTIFKRASGVELEWNEIYALSQTLDKQPADLIEAISTRTAGAYVWLTTNNSCRPNEVLMRALEIAIDELDGFNAEPE